MYSYKWATRECATQQSIVFTTPSLKQGIKIALYIWKRGQIFYLSLTLERLSFPIIPDYSRSRLGAKLHSSRRFFTEPATGAGFLL